MSGPSREHPFEARRVVSAAGAVLVVVGDEPLPVGTRVVLTLAGIDPAGPELGQLRGKITDVRRAEGAYALSVRLHSVTRAQRAALAALA